MKTQHLILKQCMWGWHLYAYEHGERYCLWCGHGHGDF